MSHGAAVVFDGDSGSQLMVRGDLVKLELDGAPMVSCPPYWGLVHDPLGVVFDPCAVLVCPYTIDAPSIAYNNPTLGRIAHAYFGNGVQVRAGTVEIPSGSWHRLGRIKQIFYARYGDLEGKYFHPFSESAPDVELFEQSDGTGYLLRLPDGCVVDSHGFVWP